MTDASGAVVIGGVMEHIEEAGIHSGDRSCVVPPYLVADRHLATIRDYTRRVARALDVVGLVNAQFAIKDDTVYVLEVNPRASRTVPYLSKATGVPLAKIAAPVMVGKTLSELGLVDDLDVVGVFVKAPVFPFVRLPGVDTILGPEMKSTGEVMGGAATFGAAYVKAQLAAGQRLPHEGTAFISVNDVDKPSVVPIARDLVGLGFSLLATHGTAAYLRAHGLEVERPGALGRPAAAVGGAAVDPAGGHLVRRSGTDAGRRRVVRPCQPGRSRPQLHRDPVDDRYTAGRHGDAPAGGAPSVTVEHVRVCRASGGHRHRRVDATARHWERVRVRNDDSIVLDVRYGDVAVLLPGDIGREVEGGVAGALDPVAFRIVKVPHHGSGEEIWNKSLYCNG